MVESHSLRKLVVELRYKPELRFYSKMDVVGANLSDDFPDWQRSPLTVEVRNKKKHRRVFLSHQRCFYETDLIPAFPNPEFDFAEKTLTEVCAGIGLREVRRIGLRQWFASDLDKSFALMVDEVASRFHNQGDDLRAILSDRTHDVAYAADFEASEGWKYHLRLGPMTREQWFQAVSHEANIFESSEHGKEASFEEYRKGFPENFLYVDVDCYKEDVPADRFAEFVTTFRRKSHDLVGKLIRYCRG